MYPAIWQYILGIEIGDRDDQAGYTLQMNGKSLLQIVADAKAKAERLALAA